MTLSEELVRASIQKLYVYVKEHDTRFASYIEPLYGQGLAFSLTSPLDVTIAFRLDENELRWIESNKATVILKGSWRGFLSQIPEFSFLAPDPLSIEGDIEAAQNWQRLFKKLKPDWPALLEPIFGEITTGVLAEGARFGIKEMGQVKKSMFEHIKMTLESKFPGKSD